MVTGDGPAKEWPPSVLDPLIAEREIAACRPLMPLERAMELIAENARLRAQVTELENDRALRDPAFALTLETRRGDDSD